MNLNELTATLRDGSHSLVVANGDVSTFDGGGVSDLLRLLAEDAKLLHGASVADKVVGKAAAALMVLAGVKEIYAEVISIPALNLLKANGIITTYGQAVPNITNRTGTGLCPLETRCMTCTTPKECLVQIQVFMEEMKKLKG